MRLLVLSDIHGNRFGLEAALTEAGGDFDQVLCLGDVVGYGAHPNECCETLRAARAWCLKGNHDAAAIEQLDISWFNSVARAAILWTRRQLSVENITWLESLRPTLDREDHGFQAVHGSLREPLEEYIIGPSVAQPTFSLMRRALCFYGHTHVADCYRCLNVAGERYRMEHAPLPRGGALQLEEPWQYLINPGSCGQPRDGNPQARYALLDTAEKTVEVRALDYDWQAARDAIFSAGLPRLLGERLGKGQ